MPKEKRIMPLPLQNRTIRRTLRKANPDVDDIDFETENCLPDSENELCDWTSCLEEVSLPENIKTLEDRFPKFNWRLPKKQKGPPKGPRQSMKMYKCQTSEGPGLCADAVIVVRSHKVPDKRARVVKSFGRAVEYEPGRLQITVPGELIGIKAKVHIEFPNAPEIKKKRRRGRKVCDYWQRF
jgi:hypothetical protein